nr:transposase, MuDR, plant [Tanacetum cinerariifolium]
MNNNDDGGYEEYDVDEDDLEEDSKSKLDAMIETLCPNQDEEVALGIQSVRNHYRILQQIKEPTTNEPEKEVKHGDEEANNSWNENENYLDYFNLESLHEDVLKDGTIELRRTPVRFLRYKENTGAVSFSIGLSFADHHQFKKPLLKYAVQEKKDYKFVRNASSRVRVKCIDEHCKWMVCAASELHDGKKYFLVVGNKMHKAFPLLGESSHWQYKFPLPVEGVPTARRMEIPLPRVCTAMMKKLPVKENWQLH